MEKEIKKGRVVAEHRGAYVVACNEADGRKEFLAKVSGRQMFVAQGREDFPAVGDWVLFEVAVGGMAVIKEVLPRKTIIKRLFGDKNKTGIKTDIQIIATNIDAAFIVQAVGRDYNLNRFERYFTLLEGGGVEPVVVLNKIDEVGDDEIEELVNAIKKRFHDVEVVAMSAKTGKGTDGILKFLENEKTYCFLGSSGVGKSTIVNWLMKKEIVATGEISEYSGRGKHVTTSRQMYFLPASPAGGPNGAMIIDNPGIREVGLTDEIVELVGNCKYSDCTHTNEPGCKFLEEIKKGTLDEDKHKNYVRMKKEVDYYAMSGLDKRGKKKDFGKFVSRAKKTLKKYNIKDY